MDINSELVNVYQCIQQEVSKVIALLAMHQAKHCKEYYYQMRSRADGNRLERAARLIYLNRTCFNGLYRENSRGQFNVPIGSYKNPKICYPELLYTVSDLLQSTEILCSPFDAVLEKATGSSDFVYFDPPYYPLSATSNFTSYSRFAFMEADQIRLQQAFAELAGRGVKVMLSNSDCPFVREFTKISRSTRLAPSAPSTPTPNGGEKLPRFWSPRPKSLPPKGWRPRSWPPWNLEPMGSLGAIEFSRCIYV